MANALYGKGRETFLVGDIHWDSDDIKIGLMDDAEYTVTIDTDQYMNIDTYGAGAAVAISGNLASKTQVLGTADADDIVLSSVTGDECEIVVVFADTDGGETQSGTNDLLIAYYDTFASGMPVTPNGGDITIAWHASGMFKLQPNGVIGEGQ